MSRRRQRAAKRRAREEAANLPSAPQSPMGGTVDARKAVAVPTNAETQSRAPEACSEGDEDAEWNALADERASGPFVRVTFEDDGQVRPAPTMENPE